MELKIIKAKNLGFIGALSLFMSGIFSNSAIAYVVKVMTATGSGSGNYNSETRVLDTITHIIKKDVDWSKDLPIQIQLPYPNIEIIPLDKNISFKNIYLSSDKVAQSSINDFKIFGSKTNGVKDISQYTADAFSSSINSENLWNGLRDFGPGNSGAPIIYKDQGIVGYHKGSIIYPTEYCTEVALNTKGVFVNFCRDIFGSEKINIVGSEQPELAFLALFAAIIIFMAWVIPKKN